jgi:hypothetical protein
MAGGVYRFHALGLLPPIRERVKFVWVSKRHNCVKIDLVYFG